MGSTQVSTCVSAFAIISLFVALASLIISTIALALQMNTTKVEFQKVNQVSLKDEEFLDLIKQLTATPKYPLNTKICLVQDNPSEWTKQEHARGVQVSKEGITIKHGGLYYVYTSLSFTNPRKFDDLQNVLHHMRRLRPTFPTEDGVLLTSVHSWHPDDVNNPTVRFIGGTFRLKAGDFLKVLLQAQGEITINLVSLCPSEKSERTDEHRRVLRSVYTVCPNCNRSQESTYTGRLVSAVVSVLSGKTKYTIHTQLLTAASSYCTEGTESMPASRVKVSYNMAQSQHF